MRQAWRLAIDLGAHRTKAVHCPADQAPERVEFDDQPGFPSLALRMPDGGYLVGSAAEAEQERRQLATGQQIRDALRRGEELACWGGPVAAAEVAAQLLGHAATAAARQHAGAPPELTVLTHPADWPDPARHRLRDAGRLAGLGEVELLSEPVAAAAGYFASDAELGPESVIAVYDLGHSALRIALVAQHRDGSYELRAPQGGLADFGGAVVDARLLGEVLRGCEIPETPHPAPQYRHAIGRVRRAKELLCELPEHPLQEVALGEYGSVSLTMQQLRDAVAADVQRGLEELERTCDAADLGDYPFRGVYLCGGSSSIPGIGEALRSTSYRVAAPPRHGAPAAPVAFGAAVWLCQRAVPTPRLLRRADSPSPSGTSLQGPKNQYGPVSFLPDGSAVAVAVAPDLLEVWRLGSDNRLYQVAKHNFPLLADTTRPPVAAEFTRAGGAAVCTSSTITYLPPATVLAAQEGDTHPGPEHRRRSSELAGLVQHGAAASPGHERVVVWGRPRLKPGNCSELRLFEVGNTGQDWLRELSRTRLAGVGSVIMLDDGHTFAVSRRVHRPEYQLEVGLYQCVVPYRIDEWELQERLAGHSGRHHLLASAARGTRLAVGATPNAVTVLDHTERRHQWQITDALPISSVALSPDGALCATGSVSGEVRVWGVEDGEQYARLSMDDDQPVGVAFSPVGTHVVGHQTSGVSVWCLPDSMARPWG